MLGVCIPQNATFKYELYSETSKGTKILQQLGRYDVTNPMLVVDNFGDMLAVAMCYSLDLTLPS